MQPLSTGVRSLKNTRSTPLLFNVVNSPVPQNQPTAKINQQPYQQLTEYHNHNGRKSELGTALTSLIHSNEQTRHIQHVSNIQQVGSTKIKQRAQIFNIGQGAAPSQLPDVESSGQRNDRQEHEAETRNMQHQRSIVIQNANLEASRSFNNRIKEPVVPAVGQFLPQLNHHQIQSDDIEQQLPKSRSASEPPVNQFQSLQIMRTVKQPVVRSKEQRQVKDPILQQQILKLVQRAKAEKSTHLQQFQTSKVSTKSFGTVKAFAANTNVGTVRKANEDRITIILNVVQPPQKTPKLANWPKIQIFGVFDGHGGHRCAEFIKDTFHNNIILSPEFPQNVVAAITQAAFKTEAEFFEQVAFQNHQVVNKSGTCAILVLVINDFVHIINVGDSRAICSQSTQEGHNLCSQVVQLSHDHKPSDPGEFHRLVRAGGYIYQTQTIIKQSVPTNQVHQVRINEPPVDDSEDDENPFVGPYRVFPGRLSVCRTFGDAEAKIASLGGIENCVTCLPEIISEPNATLTFDYIIIGSDGIFDKLKNEQINQIVWDIATFQRTRHLSISNQQPATIHTICGLIADEIIQAAARSHSIDNLSVVFIAFKKFEDYIQQGIELSSSKPTQSSAYGGSRKQEFSPTQTKPIRIQSIDRLHDTAYQSQIKLEGKNTRSTDALQNTDALSHNNELPPMTQSISMAVLNERHQIKRSNVYAQPQKRMAIFRVPSQEPEPTKPRIKIKKPQ